MEYKTAHELFLSMENKFDVYNIYINGIQVWDFVRLALSDQIQSTIKNQDQERRDTPSKTENSRSRNATNTIPFISTQKDLVFYSHGRRKLLSDGLWWDIYIDPVVEDCDLDYLCLENNGDSNHPEPAKTTHLKYTDLFFDLANIYRQTLDPNISISENSKKKLNDIDSYLSDTFGIEAKLLERVKEVIQKIKTTTPVYTEWLQRINPNAVVTWARPRYLIYACKQLDIPVIELQHGVIHRYHYDYSYPSVSDVAIFPDYLFTFGEYWKEIVEYPIDQNRIRVTGYPFAKKQFQEYKNRQKKKQVLFLSQPSIGTRLSKLATNFSLSNNDYHVVYKLHPREEDQWKSDYPWLQDADIQIASTEDLPLYALLSESAVQVGVTSTALYEGAMFDTETYILNNHNLMQVRYLLDNGAKLIESSTDLESYLEKKERAVVEGKKALLLNRGQTVIDEIESVMTFEECPG